MYLKLYSDNINDIENSTYYYLISPSENMNHALKIDDLILTLTCQAKLKDNELVESVQTDTVDFPECDLIINGDFLTARHPQAQKLSDKLEAVNFVEKIETDVDFGDWTVVRDKILYHNE